MGWIVLRRAKRFWPNWKSLICWPKKKRSKTQCPMAIVPAWLSSRSSPINGMSMRPRLPNPPSKRSKPARQNSSRKAGKTHILNGCVTSSPGVFRASSGGGIKSRPGMTKMANAMSLKPKRKRKLRPGRALHSPVMKMCLIHGSAPPSGHSQRLAGRKTAKTSNKCLIAIIPAMYWSPASILSSSGWRA